MQFSAIQSRVADETGLSTTTDATQIKAWINGAYQQLSGFYDWPWLLTNFVVQTRTDITTGTVSVSALSNTITWSAGQSISLANDYMIKFTGTGGSSDWYLISAHAANASTATISSNYNGLVDYTSGTYIVRRVFWSLPTTVDRLIDLRQATTNMKLEGVDAATFDKIIPDPETTGTPIYYYLTGMSPTTNAWQIGLFPTPSAFINLQGRGYQTITELSGDTDLPLIPAKWHNVLVFLALALYGHDFIDDTRAQSAMARAKEIVAEMVKECNPVPGKMNVIQAWDTRVPRSPLSLNLPTNYPRGWGGWY